MSIRLRLVLVAATLAVPASSALALGSAKPAPGGPAPSSLLGTWRTTLTRADQNKAAVPAHMFNNWDLVIVNAGYLAYKRALGLRPAGQGGDTVPFGVTGKRIFIQCLDEQGQPLAGYGIYTWAASTKALKLRLVADHCKNSDRRNYITILTSEPWHRVR